MDHHLPFIDHQSEVAYIDKIIQEWGTRRILCIDGPAGSGKSYLLQEIQKRYASGSSKTVPVFVSDRIDFQDPALHMVQNIGCKVAFMLGEKLFEPYLRVLLNWRRMEVSGEGIEHLSQASLAVNRTFVECFKMVSARVVLLLDAIEAIETARLLPYIAEISRQLENVVIIIAGRTANGFGEVLQAEVGKDVQILNIQPFSKNAAETYIHVKQATLQTSLEPAIMPHIMLFTSGNPVLLDLAIERFTHGPVPAWLNEQNLDDLDEAGEVELQRQFDQEIGLHIANTHTLTHLLTLLLSRFSPLSVQMAATLLDILEASAYDLFEEMRQYVSIKTLPDGSLCLHAAAARIISEYVWATLDPSGERLQHYALRATRYLDEQIQAITLRLDQLRTVETTEIAEHDLRVENRDYRQREHYMHLACNHFIERVSLEQELDRLQVQQLHYALYMGSEQGIATFASMFDKATQDYHFRLRRTLLETTEQHLHRIAPEHFHSFESRRTICLLDSGAYEQAYDLATTLLSREEITQEERIDILIQRGNACVRLGKTQEALQNFNEAMQACKEHNLERQLAQAQQARGWAYCNHGRYDLALDDYLEAYLLSLKISDFPLIAWILQNISFIHTLRGDRHAALESCYAALDLWDELGDLRGHAVAYTVLGEAYSRFNQPLDALHYYTRALDIFARQDDIEWMSIVRSGRAFAYQSLGELDKAEIEQLWALDHGPITLKPRILHSQFLTHLTRNDIPAARQKLEECHTISQQIGDLFNDYKSFADIVELAWEFDEWAKWHYYLEEHTRLYARREGIDSLRLRGSCLRKIADMAVCQGDYAEALETYEHALPLIAEYEVHERYTIRAQLRQTDKRLRDRVPESVMHQLGKDLAIFWESRPELVTKYPEVLLMFKRW